MIFGAGAERGRNKFYPPSINTYGRLLQSLRGGRDKFDPLGINPDGRFLRGSEDGRNRFDPRGINPDGIYPAKTNFYPF